MSSQQAEFAADPGGATAKLLLVVGSLWKEDGAEIAIAEAMDGELAGIDSGEECSVVG
jgi:hypothetical protein